MPSARCAHSATLLPSGKVLVAGGRDGSSHLAGALLFDPATEAWTDTGSLAAPRSGHTATLLASAKVLIAGGENDGSTDLADTELFDPVTGTWSVGASMAAARIGHSATLLPSGRVLVAGGRSGATPLEGAELFDEGRGASEAWTPTLTGAIAASFPGDSASVTGLLFTGISEGSTGSSASSPANNPVLQLRRLDNEAMAFAAATAWTPSTATFVLPPSLQSGHHLAWVVVNGVLSNGLTFPVLDPCTTVDRCGSECQACGAANTASMVCAGSAQPAARSCQATCSSGYSNEDGDGTNGCEACAPGYYASVTSVLSCEACAVDDHCGPSCEDCLAADACHSPGTCSADSICERAARPDGEDCGAGRTCWSGACVLIGVDASTPSPDAAAQSPDSSLLPDATTQTPDGSSSPPNGLDSGADPGSPYSFIACGCGAGASTAPSLAVLFLLGSLALPRRRHGTPRLWPAHHRRAVALLCLWLIPAVATAGEHNPFLAAAMRLYRDLEYESALAKLKRAQQQPDNTPAEEVQIDLYLGLIEFELGDTDAAQSAFKRALAQDGTAVLPGGVSPKVSAAFEKARHELLDGARSQPLPSVAQEDPVRPVSFVADLRAEGQPGDGLGFELGAGVGGRCYAFTLHGILGRFFGLSMRGTLVFPRLAAGFGVYGSLDAPVLFFAPDADDGRAGGALLGGGAALGARYEVTPWLWPFVEVAGRYYFLRPDSTGGLAPYSVLVAGGLAVRVP
ncbi:MAG: hypothetical protein HY901_25005 [Deltaproteobacteria bacterium]|nr:hypothetical protein [Deltaproteobacteria bacterium]